MQSLYWEPGDLLGITKSDDMKGSAKSEVKGLEFNSMTLTFINSKTSHRDLHISFCISERGMIRTAFFLFHSVIVRIKRINLLKSFEN